MFDKAGSGSASALNIQEMLQKTRTGSASTVNVQQRLVTAGRGNETPDFQNLVKAGSGPASELSVPQMLEKAQQFCKYRQHSAVATEGWYRFCNPILYILVKTGISLACAVSLRAIKAWEFNFHVTAT